MHSINVFTVPTCLLSFITLNIGIAIHLLHKMHHEHFVEVNFDSIFLVLSTESTICTPLTIWKKIAPLYLPFSQNLVYDVQPFYNRKKKKELKQKQILCLIFILWFCHLIICFVFNFCTFYDFDTVLSSSFSQKNKFIN